MGMLRNCVGLYCFLALMLSPAVAAERALLDPDWNDVVVAKARSALDSARAARPANADTNKDADIPLSLPRWGLGNKIDRPTTDERSRARAALPTASVPGWPSCAKLTADPKPLTDRSGFWYTDTYDYGCVVISISGDRAARPDRSFPAGISPPDECSDPNAADSPDDTRGRFELQLSLNRIPYSIEGHCSEEADSFCRNRAGRCALVGRLIFRGGSPQ